MYILQIVTAPLFFTLQYLLYLIILYISFHILLFLFFIYYYFLYVIIYDYLIQSIYILVILCKHSLYEKNLFKNRKISGDITST